MCPFICSSIWVRIIKGLGEKNMDCRCFPFIPFLLRLFLDIANVKILILLLKLRYEKTISSFRLFLNPHIGVPGPVRAEKSGALKWLTILRLTHCWYTPITCICNKEYQH